MSGRGAHIVRTALQGRQMKIFSARISNVERLSSTVKSVALKVENYPGNEPCSFKAGQWLDFFAPGISHIGGFSMCSPPHELAEKRILQLAIKRSEDPVAQWIHQTCSIGDQVRFRFGGDFYYDPSSDVDNHSLCLIAGGVGMNPLMSILSETLHYDQMNGINQRRVILLQSAKNEDELLYKDKTKALAETHKAFKRRLFTTEPIRQDSEDITKRRVHQEDLRESIQECGQKTKYFICGPTTMIDQICDTLIDLGIQKQHIHYEKWS